MTSQIEPDTKNIPRDQKTPFMKPCGCGNLGIQIQWDDDDDNELVVFAYCDQCGATGPHSKTDSGGRTPLGHAEAEAIKLWNQHRTVTLLQAMELPQLKLLFLKLLYFRNKAQGAELEYLLDATYLEVEKVFNQLTNQSTE